MLIKESPAASLGIKEGDAHVIRNAGGLAYAHLILNMNLTNCFNTI